MTSVSPPARLDLDDAVFRENYDRVPLGFNHNLYRLALFENEASRSLCERYAAHPGDYFDSQTPPSAGGRWPDTVACALPVERSSAAFTLTQRARANTPRATH